MIDSHTWLFENTRETFMGESIFIEDTQCRSKNLQTFSSLHKNNVPKVSHCNIFVNIVIDGKPLTTFAKSSILDLQLRF